MDLVAPLPVCRPRRPFISYFVFGLLINLLFLVVLLSFDVSRKNLYPSTPEAPTIWRTSDVGTYVRSAQAYCATGTFAGSDGLPDFHRTVGYPAFLAFTMTVGGKSWVEVTWLLQAVLFAFIYPALAFVAREWFGGTDRQVNLVVLVYALIGAGWAYSPILLTDQLFAVCLWGALASGTQAMRRGGLPWWLAHGSLLGAAASIRPTLALFPFGFAALLLALRPADADPHAKAVFLRRIVVVVAIQMVLCQAPAIRNYLHRGIWLPSDVMVNNLADYLAKDVLAFGGDLDSYPPARAAWRQLPLRGRLAAQTEFAKSVFSAHPFATLGLLGVNFGINTLETHWIQAMHFFRQSLHSDLRRWVTLSPALKVFHALWALVHACLALAACLGLRRLMRQRRWWFLLFILIFSLPYLYGATDAQGARFRLYLEGLILMLALCTASCRAATGNCRDT